MAKKLFHHNEATFNIDLGKRIKALRKSKGMTQVHMAKLLGVSGPALCQYETGICALSSFRLCLIAKALDTTPTVLTVGLL